MRVSLFRSEKDNAPQTEEMSWAELTKRLTVHRWSPCGAACVGKDCPHKLGEAWSPTEFNGKRANVNAVGMGVAVFDVDHVDAAGVKAIVVRLQASGYAFAFHSSHSHKPPADCAFRFVLPFSRAVTAAEGLRVRDFLAEKLGIPHDTKAKDLARIYFLPSAPVGARVGAGAAPGKEVDVDLFLAEAVASPPPLRLVPTLVEETSSPGAAVDEPIDLQKIRETLKGARMGKQEVAEVVRRILKGEPLAAEGERDDTLQKAAGALVFHTPQETPVPALLELMRPSLQRMPGAAPAQGTWLDVAREKLERAKERRAGELARHAAEQEAARIVLATESAKADAPSESFSESVFSYPPEDLRRWMKEQGCDTDEDFKPRWIIHKGETYFVFVNGKYQSAIGKADLDVSLPRDLARAPVTMQRPTKDGARDSTPKEILRDYSTVARNLSASLVLQKSIYDARTQTFHEAMCPLRKIAPKFHPEIDQWLTLLGGDDAEKLKDWVASATRLDRQMAAIYFHAIPGAGKNLFAQGLARLWTTSGASDLDHVFADFNDSLTRCPLIFADEKLPRIKDLSSHLRKLIGSTSRTLSRKYMPTTELQGAVRLIIAANNNRAMDRGEELSSEDLKAISNRILYIRPHPTTAEYLISLGGPPVLDKWKSEDKLAAHALYLAANRKVDDSARFLVEGSSTEFHRNLITQSGVTSSVCEFLVSWASDPLTKKELEGKLLMGEGAMWVATEALLNANQWDARVPSAKVPSAHRAGRALSAISSNSFRVLIGERQHKFHAVDFSLVRSWAEQAHVGDIDEMERRLNQANPLLKKAKERHGAT